MATFQERIVEYIGADTDVASITDVLTAGAKKIVDLLPYEKLEKIAKAIDVPAAGVAISGYRLMRDQNGFRAYDDSLRGCRTIPSHLAYRSTDPNSLHYAPANDPVCYILNQKFYTKPSDGSVDGIAYPTVLYSESAITDFPSEWVQGVVLYGAIQRALNKAATAIADLDGLSMGTAATPSTPAVPSFTYTDATLGAYSSTTIGALPTPPVYTEPTTTFSITTLNTYVNTDKDIELSQAELNHQKSLLEKYQLDIQNELGTFNANNADFQLESQRLIEQARITSQENLTSAKDSTDLSIQNRAKQLEADIQEYIQTLQKFQSDVALYAQNVNLVVSTYSTNLQRDSLTVQNYFNLVKELRLEYNEIVKAIQ